MHQFSIKTIKFWNSYGGLAPTPMHLPLKSQGEDLTSIMSYIRVSITHVCNKLMSPKYSYMYFSLSLVFWVLLWSNSLDGDSLCLYNTMVVILLYGDDLFYSLNMQQAYKDFRTDYMNFAFLQPWSQFIQVIFIHDIWFQPKENKSRDILHEHGSNGDNP